MYVPLSDMIPLTSSSRSVKSQSSLRGSIAVSLEITSLLYDILISCVAMLGQFSVPYFLGRNI